MPVVGVVAPDGLPGPAEEVVRLGAQGHIAEPGEPAPVKAIPGQSAHHGLPPDGLGKVHEPAALGHAGRALLQGLLDRPALDAAGVSQVHSQPYLNLKGRGVLIGFVDTGIDYTQDVFRYEDGSSKIQYIYDQTADGTPPSGFLLGREYSKADIDAALASGTRA